MTIATTATWSPTVEGIVKRAFQLAGVLGMGRTLSAAEATDGREHLEDALKAARPASLTQIEDVTATLTAGTGDLTAAADTLEVDVHSVRLVSPGETTERPVAWMDFSTYNMQTDHTTQALPYGVYVKKTNAVVLRFYPVPDLAYTVKYRRERITRDATAGSTIDRSQRWIESVVYMVAHKVALQSNVPLGKVKYLADEWHRLEEAAQGRETSQGGIQFELGRD